MQTFDAAASYVGGQVPVAVSAANVPATDVPVPMAAGGEAKMALIPAPETVEDADSVVKAPVEAEELPIGPGVARRSIKPCPDTIEVADKVVKAPVEATVLPIGPGWQSGP